MRSICNRGVGGSIPFFGSKTSLLFISLLSPARPLRCFEQRPGIIQAASRCKSGKYMSSPKRWVIRGSIPCEGLQALLCTEWVPVEIRRIDAGHMGQPAVPEGRKLRPAACRQRDIKVRLEMNETAERPHCRGSRPPDASLQCAPPGDFENNKEVCPASAEVRENRRWRGRRKDFEKNTDCHAVAHDGSQ